MPPSPASWHLSSYLFARWHLFRHVGYLRHQQQVDLWPFDLESGVLVTCDVGYLYANFSLSRPLCSRLRPDVWDRQRDVRQKHHLIPLPYGGRDIPMLTERTDIAWFSRLLRYPARKWRLNTYLKTFNSHIPGLSRLACIPKHLRHLCTLSKH